MCGRCGPCSGKHALCGNSRAEGFTGGHGAALLRLANSRVPVVGTEADGNVSKPSGVNLIYKIFKKLLGGVRIF